MGVKVDGDAELQRVLVDIMGTPSETREASFLVRDDLLRRYGLIKLNQTVVKVRVCTQEKEARRAGSRGTEGSKEGDSGDEGSGSDDEEDEAEKLVRKKGKSVQPESPKKKKGAQRPQAGKSIRIGDVPSPGEEELAHEGAEGGDAGESYVNIMDDDEGVDVSHA